MRIKNQTQISENILNLLALIELQTADHAVGNTALNQSFLENTRLRIGAVKHSHIAQLGVFLLLQLLHALNNEARLVMLVRRFISGNQRACIIIRPQAFRLASGVIVNYGIRCIKDNLRAAVVLLQLHHLRFRIILFEVQNIADVRTTPAINALVSIAHHADIMMLGRENLRQQILRMVGVLILVDHNIIKFILILVAYLFVLLEQTQRQQQQVIEIDSVISLQLLLISSINFCYLLLMKFACGLRKFQWRLQRVLRIADIVKNRRILKALVVKVHLLEHLLDDILRIRRIINSKIVAVCAQLVDIITQHTRTEGVEGKQPHALRSCSGNAVHTLAHFSGGLIRKGNRQNAVRTHALLQKMRNTAGQHLRLAAACTCQNQHRSIDSLYCFYLF